MHTRGILVFIESGSTTKNIPAINAIHTTYTNMVLQRIVFPKVRKLIENNNAVTIVTDDERVRKTLENSDVRCIPYTSDIPPANTDLWSDALTLAKIGAKDATDEGAAYNGINLLKLIESYLMSEYIAPLKDVNTVCAHICKVAPDELYVVNGQTDFGRIVSELGKKNGIPVTALQANSIASLERAGVKILKKSGKENWDPLYMAKPHCTHAPKKGKGRQRDTGEGNVILLITNEKRAFSFSKPWIEAVRKDGENEVIVAGLEDAWAADYRELGIQYRCFDDYATASVHEVVSKEAERMERLWRKLRDDEHFKESFIYRGVPLWGVVGDSFEYIFSKVFRRMVSTIEIVKNILDVERPDAVVVLDDRGRFGRAVTWTCMTGNVPTLIVQHGIVSDTALFGPIFADKMAVFGGVSRDILVKRGVEPERIAITGQPRFDRLVHRDFPPAGEIRQSLGIKNDAGLFVLTTQIDNKEGEELFRCVAKAMQAFPDKYLVVKVHPGGSVEFYQQFADELGLKNVTIVKKIDLYGLLAACEIMITSFSTTGLEAMILNKPVIAVNLTNTQDTALYAEHGAALGVYAVDDLVPAIKNTLYDEKTRDRLEKNREKFVYQNAYKMDGKAAERVAKLICEMAAGAKKKPDA